ncbi:MAG: HlyD family efflux transporter periplasmic adaptor subunit [Synechococcus sp. ELA057]
MRRPALKAAGASSHSDSRIESRSSPWLVIALGGSVSGLVLVGLVASAFVKVDQLVRAPGKLEPIRSTQDLKAPESGVVTAVYVKEGQQVAAGQALALIDPTILRGRDQALRDQSRQLGLITSQELVRLEGALGEARAARQGLEQNRLILEQQLGEMRRLQAQGAASRFQTLDYEKQLSDVRAKLLSNAEQQRKLIAESAQKRAELGNQQAQNTANRVETETRLDRVTLRAPVKGSVLNLKAKTGSVVNGAGEPLMQLVPVDNLQAKVNVSNLDLAFVRPGQAAEISLVAYDPSRYGYLDAKVATIGTDALPPDAQFKEPRFPVGLRLNSQSLRRNGEVFPLQAGMAISADLKLEKRTLLELFFSSIAKSTRSLQGMR